MDSDGVEQVCWLLGGSMARITFLSSHAPPYRPLIHQLSRMNYFHEVREAKARIDATRAPIHASSATSRSREAGQTLEAGSVPARGAGVVRAFLRGALPGVADEDLRSYEGALLREGFDSEAMLALLQEDDLEGWRKAHKRAVLLAVGRLKGGQREAGR
jgi:hypothetical protein